MTSSIRIAESIPVGSSIHCSVLSEPFVIFHTEEGQYHAIQNPCARCFTPSTFLGQPVDLTTMTVKCATAGHEVHLETGAAAGSGPVGQMSAKVHADQDGVHVTAPEALSQWVETILVERRCVADNVDAFVFEFPQGVDNEALLYGHGIVHVSSKAVVNGSSQVREYTPTRTTEGNRVEIVVKNYPEIGVMSKHYHSLQVGDKLVQRVNKRITFNVEKLVKKGLKSLVMIGAGSGITPMFQVLSSELGQQLDNIVMIGFFRNECDVIHCPFELPANVTVKNIITQPTGCALALQKAFENETIPRGEGSDASLILWSGPRGFNSALDNELENRDFFGFHEDSLHEMPN